jgi:hypothetical protein
MKLSQVPDPIEDIQVSALALTCCTDVFYAGAGVPAGLPSSWHKDLDEADI